MTKKLILTMALLVAVATIFVACEEPTYNVQVTAAEGGTVEGKNGEYKEGEMVVFKAIPDDGYYFSQWSDGNTDNPRAIVVGEADITLTAEFVLPTIETVDLGLTSGNLWATCNIGTINPWNYGCYYAWGETQTKDNYSWETYKYCNGSAKSLTKYNYHENFGPVDNKTTLESVDDVATAIFGAAYSMPSSDDGKELADECYWVWTSDYNDHKVNGYIVYRAKNDADKGAKVYKGNTPSASYSLSDAHIFLPAAGGRGDEILHDAGLEGYYWFTSISTTNPSGASRLSIFSTGVDPRSGNGRFVGFSVRPIKRP